MRRSGRWSTRWPRPSAPPSCRRRAAQMRKPHPKTGFIPVERPPGAIGIEDFAQAHYAFERALEYRDYSPLLARMRAGKALPAEQKLFADIYEKKLKGPPHRPPKWHPEAVRFRDLWLALCVSQPPAERPGA